MRNKGVRENLPRRKSYVSDRMISRLLKLSVLSLTVVLCSTLMATASEDLPQCKRSRMGGPLFITEDCSDPLFTQPVIDFDEWRETQNGYSYRYVNGHFAETDTRFSFYFPPQDVYEGRFFHYTLPAPDSAPGTEDTKEINIEFGSDSGAYFVQTNGGGSMGIDIGDSTDLDINAIDLTSMDGTISGYRADAAAARFSKELAAEMYGEHRPYGYRFGGSGGGYKTISGLSIPAVFGTDSCPLSLARL